MTLAAVRDALAELQAALAAEPLAHAAETITRPTGAIARAVDAIGRAMHAISRPAAAFAPTVDARARTAPDAARARATDGARHDVTATVGMAGAADALAAAADTIAAPIDVVAAPTDVVAAPIDVVAAPIDVVARAAEAITRALEHMQFTRSYETDGPFRHERFGRTPRIPVDPLWPAHATAFAQLAAEVDDDSRMSDADARTARAGGRADVASPAPRLSRAQRRKLATLVAALTELQRQLLFDADCAESTDSHNTCRAYLQAAGYLDLAVAVLASLV